jgi:purine-binding chemotaxis protein CheW
MQNDDKTASRRQYLTFLLASEEYAVDVLSVKEIIEYGDVTKVPGTPVHVRGVINLRGSVVPVVDLAVKLGREESPLSRRSCIVIVESTFAKATADKTEQGERVVTGVVADAVNQVIEFSPDDIEPPPAFGTGVRLHYLDGIAKTGASFVLVLNMDSVLSDEAHSAATLAHPSEAEAPVSMEIPA